MPDRSPPPLPRPLTASAPRYPKSPRIRSPSPTTTVRPTMPNLNLNINLSRLNFANRLPRAVVRSILVIVLLLVGFFVVSHSRGGDGAWDASSYSDRVKSRGAVDRGDMRNLDTWKGIFGGGLKAAGSRIPSYRSSKVPKVKPERKARNAAVISPNATEYIPRIHRGSSRIAIPNTNPQQYELSPLPTLEEAFNHLHPMLREVKYRTPSIPREHELTEPIFQPFLTEELKNRYAHLIEEFDEDAGEWLEGGERRWYMVTVCRQVAGMLADWFSAWTVLADYLGPETLVFSLIEGDSADGSGEIFSGVMRAHLLFLGVLPENIFIETNGPPIDWESVHRIEQLAKMRNAGMQLFYDDPDGLSPDGHPWSAIVFYNDVYLSATHYLELLHQHFMQDADMTCGWDHAGKWFYDGWVGRDMSGDLYTPFPVPEEDQNLPQKAFPSSPSTRVRFEQMLPFQVFAGWNGMAVLNPLPFLPPYNVRFRRGKPQTETEFECQASESTFISWDFWKFGFSRILVVPGVHAAYGKGDAMVRGWVEWPRPEPGFSEIVEWQDEPPPKVRCHDWPQKNGKGWWAWDTVRWVDPPTFENPKPNTPARDPEPEPEV
ncbi:alpha-1,3-mannosyltransferase, partial [Tremellales sp. Uapishka_1]